MTSTMSDDSLRFASLIGRAVAAVSAGVGLLLVLALFGFRPPYKPGFEAIIAATLLGLAGAVWCLGDLMGRAIARRGRAAVAWGPAAGVASLGLGALGLALGSVYVDLAMCVANDLPFSLKEVAWSSFGKPLAFIMVAGSIPAALIGLVCAATIHCILTRQKKAPVESAP